MVVVALIIHNITVSYTVLRQRDNNITASDYRRLSDYRPLSHCRF